MKHDNEDSILSHQNKSNAQKTDGSIVWNATEIKCDFCGRSTTLGACQLWGDFALCEGCDALMNDAYDFYLQLERADG
jgi:hypothetical protein